MKNTNGGIRRGKVTQKTPKKNKGCWGTGRKRERSKRMEGGKSGENMKTEKGGTRWS